MSEQMPEVLINECAALKIDQLEMQRVVLQLPGNGESISYKCKNKPNPPDGCFCSALWRGYVAHYKITGEGTLWLTAYDYPFSGKKMKRVNEQLTGDFWLEMVKVDSSGGPFKSRIFSTVYIPFVNSIVVTDKEKWH